MRFLIQLINILKSLRILLIQMIQTERKNANKPYKPLNSVYTTFVLQNKAERKLPAPYLRQKAKSF